VDYLTPGVYREEISPRPAPVLPTGVPGFVGFARPASGASPVLLNRIEDLATALSVVAAKSYLPQVLTGFFGNGGGYCYVACADPVSTKGPEAALGDALDSLAAFDDVDLVAMPDAAQLLLADGSVDLQALARLQTLMLNHCGLSGTRVAILDCAPAVVPGRVPDFRKQITQGVAEPVNGAFYYPWIKTEGGGSVPPCGHVAGLIANTDAVAGVFKAPANQALAGVVDVEFDVDDSIQAGLNQVGVNCLRAFPGRGIRVWGARTLSSDPSWRYLNVRRLILTLGRWVELNMGWAGFEPNAPPLWAAVERELRPYLDGLWRAGALAGSAPEQAYFIRCDAETNPPQARALGQVTVEVGLAPGAPAEFVVVRLALQPDPAGTAG